MFTSDSIQTDNRHIGTSRLYIIVFTHTGQACKQSNLTSEIIVGDIIDISLIRMKIMEAGRITGKCPGFPPALLFTAKHFKEFGSFQQYFPVRADTPANIGHSQLFQ